MTTPTKVWIVTAEHREVPGLLTHVCADHATAQQKVAELRAEFGKALEYCDINEHPVIT